MQVHASASQRECLDITLSPSGACAEGPGLDCGDEGRWNHLGFFNETIKVVLLGLPHVSLLFFS